MADLNRIKLIAKRKKIKGELSYSKTKNKRFAIKLENGKTINFGLKGGQTFIDHGDKMKRNAWQARHSKIKIKDGSLAYKNPNQPAYYSWNLLW